MAIPSAIGRRSGWRIILLVLAAIWGASFLFIKVALADLSPAELTLGRCFLGAAALALTLLVTRLSVPREPRLWAHLFLVALILNTVPFMLFCYAELRVSSVVAGVANGTAPLFAAVFAFAALRDERPTVHAVIGLVVGMAGVVVVLRVWDGFQADTIGVAAAITAAVCYGLGWVYLRYFVRDSGRSPLALTFCQLACATLQLAVICLATSSRVPTLAPATLVAILALGILGTGFAYVLHLKIIRDAGATSASTVAYLVPVFAVLIGVVVLHEPVGWNLGVGVLLVLFGAALAQRRPKVLIADRCALEGLQRNAQTASVPS
ncbi:MAG: DMT family transporter [Mycobacteriaceae bacterium]|nr:DMT family transporter [Mycobacteriaceae bacterium]